MKKIYLLAITFVLASVSTNAQIINDDIESYNTGALGPQASHWTTWSGTEGGAEDGTVTTSQANSGTKSILIAEGQVQDILLLLGNQVTGAYDLSFSMYIPANKTGYFNIQNSEIPGIQWNFHMQFNEGNANPGVAELYDASGTNQGPGTLLGTGNFNHDEWFTVSMVVDMDNLTLIVSINGNEIANTTYTGTILGALNFFSIDANNRYYLDDILYEDASLSLNDLETNAFRVYPNPVVNQLNIQSKESVNAVSIYNVLGKLVYQSSPNTISPSIDMGAYKTGIYFVEVTIGDSTKTVKVIK